jgi:molecular chaperone GrpE
LSTEIEENEEKEEMNEEVINEDQKVARLEEELSFASDEVKELTDKYLRSLADLDNQRKRMVKEKEETQKYANERLILEILPVMDNFERAIEAGENSDSAKKLLDGVRLIFRQLSEVLEKEGVKSFDSLGEKFDPYKHEAFLAIESKEHEPSTILEEVEKGYLLKDKVIRPAKVTVSKQDEVKEDDENGNDG